MTASYRLVQWNRHKVMYDLLLGAGVLLFLGVFLGVSLLTHRPPEEISPPILLMRALGALAIVLLHLILIIGPLARLTDLAAPLLYNRRHLGVTFFLIALAHAFIAVGFYGGFGVRDPVSATVAGYDSFASVSGFPFEILGFAALVVFFVMAATSHDFWLANLSPHLWKSIHMLVYVAYVLVLLHVALGALQSERSPLYPAVLLGGAALVGSLHTVAGRRERRRDLAGAAPDAGWIDAGPAEAISDGAAVIVGLRGGERIAVFRHGDEFSAISNVCAHQAGPLGEGRIIDGCVTCPWHGYQYKPRDGRSPAPYTEKVPTYHVRIDDGRVLVDPRPNPAGAPVEPAVMPGAGGGGVGS